MQPKFSKKVEFARSLFKDVGLELRQATGESLVFTNYYLFHWQVKDATTGEFEPPTVMIHMGPQSHQIRQIDVWGVLNFKDPAELQNDEQRIPIFREAVREAVTLVAPGDADGVQNWLKGYSIATSPYRDFVKLQDFASVSVVLGQITTSSSFPITMRVTEFRVIIVPKESAFMVMPGQWTGFPASSDIRQNGYRAFVSRAMWQRFATQ